MTNENSDDINVNTWTGEQTFEHLLSQGLPGKLTDMSERPLEKHDFVLFRPQAEKCLIKVERICERGLH